MNVPRPRILTAALLLTFGSVTAYNVTRLSAPSPSPRGEGRGEAGFSPASTTPPFAWTVETFPVCCLSDAPTGTLITHLMVFRFPAVATNRYRFERRDEVSNWTTIQSLDGSNYGGAAGLPLCVADVSNNWRVIEE